LAGSSAKHENNKNKSFFFSETFNYNLFPMDEKEARAELPEIKLEKERFMICLG
jgi:hypothetical protein